jgi:hypothetical protein
MRAQAGIMIQPWVLLAQLHGVHNFKAAAEAKRLLD